MNGKTKKIIQWTAGVIFSLLIIFVILISSFEIVLYSDMSVYRKEYEKYEVLDEACVGKKINEKTGRMAKHYVCADCGKEFTSKDVEVDHILPVVDPTDGFIDWNTFISRLYCTKDNLQVLCTKCHKAKTNEERKQSKVRKTRKD